VDITGHSPNKILVRGLAQVPEGRRVFGQMTVLENLEMGAFTRRDTASIREDLEITSNVRIRDVEEAQQRIVGIIRDLEEKNELIILKGGKDDIIA
jgi:ABC-type branched-subunit amino acid transport system ATPase component